MEAHGGYLVLWEAVGPLDWVGMAQDSLRQEGVEPANVSLQASVLSGHRVLRLAFDAPFTYGRRGARWYQTHHALARCLSAAAKITVHAYVFDPEYMEEVVAFGNGQRVGGDQLTYDEVDLPLDEDGNLEEAAYERMKSRWPLGHLARIFGIDRDDLLRLPRAPTALVNLDGTGSSEPLLRLLPRPFHGSAVG